MLLICVHMCFRCFRAICMDLLKLDSFSNRNKAQSSTKQMQQNKSTIKNKKCPNIVITVFALTILI